MRRWLACLTLGLTVVLAGCMRVSNDDVGVPPPDPMADARMHDQAVDALVRWDQAIAGITGPVFLPVGDSFGQIGQWEPGNEHNKDSLAFGLFVVDGDLPASPSATAQVRWDDGTTATLPMLSAVDAYDQAPRMSSTCDNCTPLHITGATLTSDKAETTHGSATIPVWVYSLAGTSVRLTRPAVAEPPVKLTPPPWDSTNPPAGLQIDSAVVWADGLTLTANFVGAGTTADQGLCGEDYTAEPVESDHAVVVIIRAKPAARPLSDPHFGCTLIGYPRSATATLAKPLGDRAVLEDRQGLPVPVTRQG
jgi:hypothetical protein